MKVKFIDCEWQIIVNYLEKYLGHFISLVVPVVVVKGKTEHSKLLKTFENILIPALKHGLKHFSYLHGL